MSFCRHISGKVVELFSASLSRTFQWPRRMNGSRRSDRTQPLKIKLNHPCQTQRSARRVCMNELFNFSSNGPNFFFSSPLSSRQGWLYDCDGGGEIRHERERERGTLHASFGLVGRNRTNWVEFSSQLTTRAKSKREEKKSHLSLQFSQKRNRGICRLIRAKHDTGRLGHGTNFRGMFSKCQSERKNREEWDANASAAANKRLLFVVAFLRFLSLGLPRNICECCNMKNKNI